MKGVPRENQVVYYINSSVVQCVTAGTDAGNTA